MEVDAMAPVKTIFLYKQAVVHFHVSESECNDWFPMLSLKNNRNKQRTSTRLKRLINKRVCVELCQNKYPGELSQF